MTVPFEESEKNLLKKQITEILNPEDEKVIGEMKKISGVVGEEIWVEVGGESCFFGVSMRSALFTASQCDWWEQSIFGPVNEDDKRWFEERSKLNNWKDRETKTQALERRSRVGMNNRFTNGDLPAVQQIASDHFSADRAKPCIHTDGSDDLLRISIRRLSDRDGAWIFDEFLTLVRKVKVRITSGHLKVDFLDSMPCDEPMSLDGCIIADIFCTDDRELIGMTLFESDGSTKSYSEQDLLGGDWTFE